VRKRPFITPSVTKGPFIARFARYGIAGARVERIAKAAKPCDLRAQGSGLRAQ
jgi:hypothetical protein